MAQKKVKVLLKQRPHSRKSLRVFPWEFSWFFYHGENSRGDIWGWSHSLSDQNSRGNSGLNEHSHSDRNHRGVFSWEFSRESPTVWYAWVQCNRPHLPWFPWETLARMPAVIPLSGATALSNILMWSNNLPTAWKFKQFILLSFLSKNRNWFALATKLWVLQSILCRHNTLGSTKKISLKHL